MSGPDVIEGGPDGRTLVITGEWSQEAERVLSRGDVDALQLNYARGFSTHSLEFLSGSWSLRALDVLDRSITNLQPIQRLAGSLRSLSVQAAPGARLDLSGLPQLRAVAGEWALVRETLAQVPSLQSLTTWRFLESSLDALRSHVALENLTIKEAPRLITLSGLMELKQVKLLAVVLARRLTDISDLMALPASIEVLQLQSCPSMYAIDVIETLSNLQFLDISEFGELPSISLVTPLQQLERFHAWGSTRIVNCDLSPLAALPRLREIRMRERRCYKPSVAELQRGIAARA